MLYNSPYRHSLSKRQQGFTLIELLMVIAVILILAGITFGISRGVQNAQARAKANAELATISQAIEQFKSRYGDYPWHDSTTGDYPNSSGEVTSEMLLYALTGRLIMKRNSTGKIDVNHVSDDLDNADVEKNPKFLDHTKFSTSGKENEPTALKDPWGEPYVYWYKREDTENAKIDNPTSKGWDVFGYHLYSKGPKGDSANNAIKAKINNSSGVFDDDFRDVANAEGIIFAGE